jgi:membrane protease subunit HflC
MPSRAFPFVVLGGLLLLLAILSMFTVSETQLAIRKQFGQIVSASHEPGLHFKWPLIDDVVTFEKRIVTQSYPGETFLTNENRGLIVDFYVKWRVKNAADYYRATGGLEEFAGNRLADIVKDGIKTVVAQRTLEQIVSAKRDEVTSGMIGGARTAAEQLGIELVDVRVQRIDLPEDVAARVFESMKQTFEKLAQQLRGEGQRDAQQIRSEAERRRTEILSNAAREALRIRGDGDEQASDIYARVYSRDPEFYAFYRSLQAYKSSLGKEGDLLLVTPDGEFFKYMKSPGPSRRR